MPPWPEWQFEYIGTRFLGKLLGLWSAFWVNLLKKLFRSVRKAVKNLRDFTYRNSSRSDLSEDARLSESSFAKKLYKMAISTLLTLGLWRIATLKAVWSTANENGHRVLAAIVLLVCASWVISLVWICFSKSKPRRMMPH